MSRPCGFRHSLKTRNKMSIAQKGRKLLNGGNFKGHKHTNETRNKISVASRKRWNKPEERAKVSGSASAFWRGGLYTTNNGYILTSGNYEHRIVMEKHLDRLLKSSEIVHHVNHNRADNRIENLQLFVNQKEHIKYHTQER